MSKEGRMIFMAKKKDKKGKKKGKK